MGRASCAPRVAAWCSARSAATRRISRRSSARRSPPAALAACRKLEIIGRFIQLLPNNWKLYAENVRDTYHASLLHLFFATFSINRLSQGGGVLVSESGGQHVSTTLAPDQAVDNAYAGMRSVDEAFRLKDPALLDIVDEHGDRIASRSCRCFRASSCSRRTTSWRCGISCRAAWSSAICTGSIWALPTTTPEMRTRRLKQFNLAGPAGFVSMEDGCVGGFVERGAATAPRGTSVVEMGGAGTESQDTRATEAAIRGFWRQWRATVGV